MSLNRLIYYSAIIGGWAAFLGWLVSAILDRPGTGLPVWLVGALVGGAIGAGLNLVAGMVNAQWKQLLKRLGIGLIAAGIGGAIGGYLGDLLFRSFSTGAYFHISPTRVLGWMIMGAGIGVVEGLYERSPSKLRNGLIGGVIGGCLGGLLFDPIANLRPDSNLSSQATGFVVLGMCIGLLIGLVKVVMKDAWLTVLDGYRPGRQLILAESNAVIGRAEYATLPLMGRGDAAEVDAEHARVVRLPDGRFAVQDNNSRTGVRVNNARVDGHLVLNDGDVIKIGMNMVRFSERHRHEGGRLVAGGVSEGPGVASVASPPVDPPAGPPLRPPVANTPPPVQPPVMRPPVAPPPPRPAPAPPPAPVATPPPRPAPQPAAPAATRPVTPPLPRPAVPPPFKPAAPPPSPAARPVVPPPRPAAPPPGPAARPPAPAAAGAGTACPSCGRQLPSNQRYCIVCDLNF